MLIRAPCILLFIALALATVSTNASAQQIDPASDPNKKILIQAVSPSGVSTVLTGEIVRGITIDREDPFDNGLADSSYARWRVEPASAARIITPMPVSPLTREIEVEFLEPGTVVLSAYGFDAAELGSPNDDPLFNIAQFAFIVQPAPQGGQAAVEPDTNTSSPLNANARAALSTINQACGTSTAPAPQAQTPGQSALRTTCTEIAVLADPAASLERLVPEEFFAIGDALTTTADNQISNVRSRIDTVRSGQRTGIDISSLTLKMWNQSIDGSILTAGKNALFNINDDNASPNVINDSPIGIFANGNISVGSIDGDGMQRNADIDTSSLILGADYRVDGNRVVGAAVGIVKDTTDFTGNDGEMNMQSLNLSAFGSWYEEDQGYADIIVDAGQSSVDMRRRINLPGQGDEYADSSTSATRLSLSINVGRTFNHGAIEFGPVGRITLTYATIDRFSETSSLTAPATGTTLDVSSHTMTSGRFALGGEISRAVSTTKAVFLPSLRIEMENESETDKGVINASFRHDPESRDMEFRGSDRDSNALLISFGSTAVFAHGQSAFVFFETRTQDSFVSQNRLRAGYRMHF